MTPSQEQQATGLMRRAQQGDEEAYAELLVLLADVTRRYVYLRLGAFTSWIDDVVQETLVSVHDARRTYDPRRPFAPWFYAIARHRLVDGLRRAKRITGREIGVDTLPEPPPERAPRAGAEADLARGPVDLDTVRAALASLPPRQREVVEALKLREESVREIAGRLGMSVSAVKVTAHRGYRALQRLLGVDHREE